MELYSSYVHEVKHGSGTVLGEIKLIEFIIKKLCGNFAKIITLYLCFNRNVFKRLHTYVYKITFIMSITLRRMCFC